MTTLSTKSTDGRTEWILEEGRLKEIGPQSPAFTLRAENTFILLKLLLQGEKLCSLRCPARTICLTRGCIDCAR